MEFEKCDIPGLILLKPRVFEDDRGYFLEPFNKKIFSEVTGFEYPFVQDNESFSTYGTLRGIHFQKPPFAQAKLVRVISGKVLDVVIDLRENSDTYGYTASFMLNDQNKHQLLIPRGFGHAFCVLSPSAIFSYKVDNYYAPNHETGIIWNDPDLNIDWKIPGDEIILSEKDNNLPSFKSYKAHPIF